jgi:oligoribonuclease NrnB/cAMP/cGMP phosphodiesterase (DHH superfamily)
MDDWLIDDDRLSITRKSVLPGEGFFHPDSLQQEQKKQEVAERLADVERVVIADPDADGLACTAILRAAFGEVALVPAGPRDLQWAFSQVTERVEPGAAVFVCDLAPDSESDLDPLPEMSDRAASVEWFDHHQWDADLRELAEEAVDRLVVGESDEECSADVAVRSLEADLPERFTELAAVTRDHDLWIRDDERSDDLADYAYWEEPEDYVEVVREHGADLPPEVTEFIEEQRVEKHDLIDRAIERAQLREIGDWTVGVTYGRCSQNEVAEALREQGADAAVIVKPAGSASIRGTEGFERCHEVARQVNGGGHPRAAGCKPDIYEDMLDYAHHWTTRGATAKQVILDGFRALEPEADDEADDE